VPLPFGERLVLGADHESRGLIAHRRVDHLLDELVSAVAANKSGNASGWIKRPK
jgi:hypothetical protein